MNSFFKRYRTAAIAVAGLVIVGSGVAAEIDSSATFTGTASCYLLNPEGDADGLLLEDGTQINFPPHMSDALTSTVALKDKVKIEGFRENKKVFKAEKITDLKTEKTVVEVPPSGPPHPRPRGPATPPPPPPGDLANPPGPRDQLERLATEGKIEHQLFGPRGEMRAVILANGTIVHFGPRLLNEVNVKTEIGQKLRANGYGTKNDLGTSFEATELSNY